MTPSPVSLRQLQYIVAVADSGGFGRAAAQCHVAQPSLSSQVALAEAQLGVQIFERSRHGVRVSSAGAVLVEQARRVLGAQRELEEVASHLRNPFHGRFRLGVIPTIGPYLLPDITAILAHVYPQLTLVWREDRTLNLVQQIKDGTLDGGILALESDIDHLEHVPLAWDPFVLAAAPGHPLAVSDKPVSLSALTDANVLLLDDGHCFRDQAWSLCAPRGAKEMSFRATSLATLVQMVGTGSSVTLLPSLALPVENRAHRLRVRSFAPPGPGRTLVLAWRRESALGTALKDVAGTIRLALSKKPLVQRSTRRRPTARPAQS
ncbi:MAG: LysR substrate-binding domain-containing protein [Vicinamibacterales bacterium]